MRLCKVLVATLGATVMLGVLTGSVLARNLSVSQTRLTSTYARVEIRGGFGTTRCNFTLSESLHSRTIAKVLGSLIGYVTAASVGGCEAGTATVLTGTLPWHDQYAGFIGTLPSINSIASDIVGAGIRVREPAGFECLMTTTVPSPLDFYRGVAASLLNLIRLGGSIACSLTVATFSGASNSIIPETLIRLI